MTQSAIRWYVVMLPGESVEDSELYGPFREEARADEVCERWNSRHATNGDRASVLPILSAAELIDAR